MQPLPVSSSLKKEVMLTLQNISYSHPNKDLLFDEISFTINRYDKIALIGNNGAGKSTLLKLIAKQLQPNAGQIILNTVAYYVPQLLGAYDGLTIAQALKVEDKLNALHNILSGVVTDENYAVLNDDWTIESRCDQGLEHWQLTGLSLSQKMGTLSGGQKTKVFLAGIYIHQPDLVLLDEPGNYLDNDGRQLLYDLIRHTNSTLIVVSHDRKLLNLLSPVYELSTHGITIHGGNYDFYCEQKRIENNALNQEIQNKEKVLRKAKEKERQTLERQQRSDNRGRHKQEKAGVSRIMMNTLRNKAENSTSKMKEVHAQKIGGISHELNELRKDLPGMDRMKFGFQRPPLHNRKILFRATNVNFTYDTQPLWKENLDFLITSGERIALKGANGAGKSTLINLLLNKLQPQTGTIYRAENRSVYIDQDYSLIDNKLSVYEQAQQFNTSGLLEHEVKTRLSRFLFGRAGWDKSCSVLSGGERMRLALCCLTISDESPDIIILDEPTNNLDIQNIEILTEATNEYEGTLIVVSHDELFLEEIHIERAVEVQ